MKKSIWIAFAFLVSVPVWAKGDWGGATSGGGIDAKENCVTIALDSGLDVASIASRCPLTAREAACFEQMYKSGTLDESLLRNCVEN